MPRLCNFYFNKYPQANMYKLCFLFFLLSQLSFGQINYQQIKKQTCDTLGDFSYPMLIGRFQNSDSTLSLAHFQALYYGGVLRPDFELKKIQDAERSIRLANYSGDFLEAYQLADSLLKEYAVSVQAYFEKAYACFNLKRFEEETYNTKRYKVLIKTILSSGDGKTIESAYQANLPNDEYEVLKFLNLTYKELTTLETAGSTFDVFSLKTNKLKIKNIFFNITKQGRVD